MIVEQTFKMSQNCKVIYRLVEQRMLVKSSKL